MLPGLKVGGVVGGDPLFDHGVLYHRVRARGLPDAAPLATRHVAAGLLGLFRCHQHHPGRPVVPHTPRAVADQNVVVGHSAPILRAQGEVPPECQRAPHPRFCHVRSLGEPSGSTHPASTLISLWCPSLGWSRGTVLPLAPEHEQQRSTDGCQEAHRAALAARQVVGTCGADRQAGDLKCVHGAQRTTGVNDES